MTELKIDRRRLLKLGISSGLLAALPVGCVRLGEEEAASLTGLIGDSPLPTDPEKTGILSAAAFETLSGLCGFVERGWELDTDQVSYLDRLRSDLEVKAGETPSYLTEYEHAVELVDVVARQSETPDQAWSTLLFSEIEAKHPEATRLGRARRLVFGEIITHQVALSGAFRSFGLLNYSGAAGGPFADPASYRRGDR
jgi:hypothetical protein